MQSDRRRLLDKLLRELVRSEARAVEHAPRESRRLRDTPPGHALRAVAAHATEMRPRLVRVLDIHGLAAGRAGLGTTIATLRHLVTQRVQDTERAYRAALLDLRHGLDVTRVLREAAHLEEMFSLIRWCDDWLTARRTLVMRVEAQLGWFARQPSLRTAQSPTRDAPGDPGASSFLDGQ